MREFREGDFIESIEQYIFDVKGLIHPPNYVIAFLRYFPNQQGDRIQKATGRIYSKIYDLTERYRYLETHASHYLFTNNKTDLKLQGVSNEFIISHHLPEKKLATLQQNHDLDPVETDVLDFCENIIEGTGIPPDKVGITGSILVGLHRQTSDLDIIIYGRENGQAVFKWLKHIYTQKSHQDFRRYSSRTIKSLLKHRWGSLSPIHQMTSERLELRKILQGLYRNREYYIRIVPDLETITNWIQYDSVEEMGQIHAVLQITNDSDSLLTPCRYQARILQMEGADIPQDQIDIISFRGKFTEHAEYNDKVEITGKLEKWILNKKIKFKIILGNSPRDMMIPK